MTKIKALDTARGIFQKWLRPLLAAGAAVIVLVTLLVTQPWSVSPQSVMAKAYAATENLQSYRMFYRSITQTAEGETSEFTTESEFSAPERYHVKLIADDDVTEFIIIGGKSYARNGDPSKNVTFAVSRSSSSFLTKEITLKMLDGLTDLKELPIENIDGTDCLHYRGRVDMEKQIEEIKTNLDPSDPHYQRLLEEAEQLRRWKTQVELWIGKHDYLIRQINYDWQAPVEDTDSLFSVMNQKTVLGARNAAIIAFFLDAGLRLSELINLGTSFRQPISEFDGSLQSSYGLILLSP